MLKSQDAFMRTHHTVCALPPYTAAEAPPATPEARQAVALAAVKGWAWSVEECIRRTPPEDITWSRISDRCGAGAGCVE